MFSDQDAQTGAPRARLLKAFDLTHAHVGRKFVALRDGALGVACAGSLRTPDNVWTLTAEVFGLVGEPLDSRTEVQPRFQVGLRWRPIDRFSVQTMQDQTNLPNLTASLTERQRFGRYIYNFIFLPPPEPESTVEKIAERLHALA